MSGIYVWSWNGMCVQGPSADNQCSLSEQLALGRNVYLHCSVGVNRSVSVAIAFLLLRASSKVVLDVLAYGYDIEFLLSR
jgi:hypothetical protein